MPYFFLEEIISEFLKNVSGYKKNRCRKDLLRMISEIKKIPYDNLFFSTKNFSITEDEKKKLDKFWERYQKNEPLSKIIQKKSFWNHDFFVNHDVLDPRPETELIIEAALSIFSSEKFLKILDIGTGSGCILLSLLEEFKNSSGIGIDISEKAISVAEKNKNNLKIDRAKFITENFEKYFWNHHEKFDLIVSNPPYIKTKDIETLDENVKNFDPLIALDGGEDGLRFYRSLAYSVKPMLNDHGAFIIEIGYGQAKDVVKILEDNNFFVENLLKDWAGIERVIVSKNIA